MNSLIIGALEHKTEGRNEDLWEKDCHGHDRAYWVVTR